MFFVDFFVWGEFVNPGTPKQQPPAQKKIPGNHFLKFLPGPPFWHFSGFFQNFPSHSILFSVPVPPEKSIPVARRCNPVKVYQPAGSVC